MSRRSDSALATILLTTRLIDRDEEPLGSGDYWALLERIEDPASLLAGPVDDARLRALLDGSTALALRLEDLERSGIKAITPFDEGYPERLRARLGTAAPAVLHVVGPVELLAEDGIGIVGSRNVGVEAREAAAEVARAAVRAGYSVVSGLAKGIDQVAMSSALEAGGTVIGIPADSIDKLVKDPSVRRAITDERLCLATPYAPSAGFSVGVAMGRNKLIYGLTRATVVVTADRGKGGTWSGAVEALQKGYGTVAVWTGAGAGEGNEELIARGAFAANEPSAVFEVPETPGPPSATTQMKLL